MHHHHKWSFNLILPHFINCSSFYLHLPHLIIQPRKFIKLSIQCQSYTTIVNQLLPYSLIPSFSLCLSLTVLSLSLCLYNIFPWYRYVDGTVTKLKPKSFRLCHSHQIWIDRFLCEPISVESVVRTLLTEIVTESVSTAFLLLRFFTLKRWVRRVLLRGGFRV